ncbi:MAG: biosynthetic arginine decarboxylase [Myxococcota bacterium]|nr:biosynthetic arginine decarboxylase [Myxococcota bacterium]
MNDSWEFDWATPFFGMNPTGRLWVSPTGRAEQQLDLPNLIKNLIPEGCRPPLLLAFPQIIQARLEMLRSTMEQVKNHADYKGAYRPVYPIKVNQHDQVLRCLKEEPNLAGFEAGSKPELMLALSLLKPGHLLICNGYKDTEYLQMALYGQLLGYRPIIVIERLSELSLALQVAETMNIEAEIGLRARLADHGSGRWSSSAGDLSKFGLTTPEIVAAVGELKAKNKLHCLRLLHFHIGSQLTELDSTDQAVAEASQIYRGLIEMGADRLDFMDVGGGLAVDYGDEGDGGGDAYLKRYFTSIVSGIQRSLRPHKIPVPDIITEAGRALVAHHAILIVEVIDASARPSPEPTWQRDECPEELKALDRLVRSAPTGKTSDQISALQNLRKKLGREFESGAIGLEHMALAEQMYWSGLARLLQPTDSDTRATLNLEKLLADCLYCNFSLFQSLPDHWALSQLFPILPVEGLDKTPNRRARIVDITCDSDGGIMRYPQVMGAKETLPIPPLDTNKPNYLAVFLTGAYQDSIGDLHNLFGDSDRVTLWMTSSDEVTKEVIPGQSIATVIEAMGHQKEALIKALEDALLRAQKNQLLRPDQAESLRREYHRNLEGYTYLEANDLP